VLISTAIGLAIFGVISLLSNFFNKDIFAFYLMSIHFTASSEKHWVE
jgi:hypothetical protein